jgi:hypothetical protein
MFQPYTHLIKPLPPLRLTIRFTYKTPEQRDQIASFDEALDDLLTQNPDLGVFDGNDTDGQRLNLFCFTSDRAALRAALLDLASQHPLPPFRITPPKD